MFSDRLSKIDTMPLKTMLGLAAGLVILCQLVAMVLVVDGQVNRAEARDAQLDSRRKAIAQCNEASSASTRQSCIEQVMATLRLTNNSAKTPQVQTFADSMSLTSGSQVGGKGRGFISATFAARENK